ncbi:YkvA family protein [Bradyrhizobium sp.]|uniref:YkvA family protein n=1 Tax=Bradyrhizobium sp. TaxID=376 RepID=UPI0025BF96DD|nr:YkvA family protein [Bradyrhizobium sp.]
MLSGIKTWSNTLKRDGHAIYLASRDPRVPWYAKALAIVVAGYALSPIDLIPDFIPIVGYLDELILLPLGIWLVVALIPAETMDEYRARADEAGRRPTSRAGMVAIILLWIAGALTLGGIGYACWSRP